MRAMGQQNARNELSYAVLLCRAEGLRRAAMQQLPDLGGDAHAQSAAEELERLLKLTGKERSEEKKQLAPRYTARKTGALGVTGALFEVWIVTEAARRSGALEGWLALITAPKLGRIDAPDVFPRMAPTGKDLEVFDIHEHMRALAPEQGRVSTKPGQTPTDSAQIRKGRYPLLGSSWALAWEQVKKELQLTYQEETRVLDRDTPVRMETLYDMLFPARKYEEDTLDGEKSTEEPNKEGNELAHAKKATKGRGRGRRREKLMAKQIGRYEEMEFLSLIHI